MSQKNSLFESLKTLAEDQGSFRILRDFTIRASYGTCRFDYAILNHEATLIYTVIDDFSERKKEKEDKKKAEKLPSLWGYCIFRGLDNYSFYNLSGDPLQYVNSIRWEDFTRNIKNGRAVNPQNNLEGGIKLSDVELRFLAGTCKEILSRIKIKLSKIKISKRKLELKLFPKRKIKDKVLYRYISSAALEWLLTRFSLNTGTPEYSLSSICSMNDRWEYAEGTNIITGKTVPFRSAEARDTYIMSLSRVDPMKSLTMWRLYGEDSKGVCLEFEVEDPGQLHKVKYIDDYTGISTLSLLNISAPPSLLFRLKNSIYACEEEVRLIVVNKNQNIASETWVRNSSSGLLFPIIKLAENNKVPSQNKNFPLRLKRIILGVNQKDAVLNQALIGKRLAELNWGNVDVVIAPELQYKPN